MNDTVLQASIKQTEWISMGAMLFSNLVLAAIVAGGVWIATRPTSHSPDQDTRSSK